MKIPLVLSLRCPGNGGVLFKIVPVVGLALMAALLSTPAVFAETKIYEVQPWNEADPDAGPRPRASRP